MSNTASAPAANVFGGDTGPAVEQIIVRDMLKRTLPFLPLVVAVAAAVWGTHGALSAAYAIALVVANFALSATLLSWSARISVGLLMGVALFGYLFRLGLITIAVLAVRNQAWVELVPLGISIIVTHLGLLFWELRYVSTSLSAPGVKASAPSLVSRLVKE